MDKNYFVCSAPNYYALAIAIFFVDNQSASRKKIVGSYRERDDFENRIVYRLKENKLLDLAINILVENQLIEIIADDFGPEVIVKRANFVTAWKALVDKIPVPFQKYERLDDEGFAWLLAALDRLNTTYDELGIEDVDFAEPDREWQPLPIDREDPNFREALGQLDDAIIHIEQDNGYAANVPEERSYVLGALRQTAEKMRNDTHISIAYLKKNAFEPLRTVVTRFGGAVVGVAATGAAAALIHLIENAETTAITAAIRAYFGL